jgi:hypothetical protein
MKRFTPNPHVVADVVYYLILASTFNVLVLVQLADFCLL